MDSDSPRDNNNFNDGSCIATDEATFSAPAVSSSVESENMVTVIIPHAGKGESCMESGDMPPSSFPYFNKVKSDNGDRTCRDLDKDDASFVSLPEAFKDNSGMGGKDARACSIPSNSTIGSTDLERVASLPGIPEVSSGAENRDIVTVLLPDVSTSNSSSGRGKKRMSYDLETKLEAINHAELYSKRAAARKYGVDTKRIREWCCYKAEIACKVEAKCGKARKRLGGGGRKVFIPVELEDALVEWFKELRARGEKVKRKAISQKAEAMWHEMKETMRDDSGTAQVGVDSFKASEGWVTSFMKRRGLTF